MISLNEAYPTAEQCQRVDLTERSELKFGEFILEFDSIKQTTIDTTALIERELERLELQKNHSPDEPNFWEGIDMYVFFKSGWQKAVYGNFIETNEVWKSYHEIKKAIYDKNKDRHRMPEGYFERFSERAIKVIVDGMASARFYFYLKDLLKKYNNPSVIQKEKSKVMPIKQPTNAPSIAMFCQLVEHCAIIMKAYDESAASFCDKVCKQFKLAYTDNVRKNYKPSIDLKKTDRYLKNVIESILPIIPEKERELIDRYITSKIGIFH